MQVLWSAEDDAKLRKLTDEKLSANQISMLMPGRSRNAVIGRQHRLKINGKGKMGRPAGFPFTASRVLTPPHVQELKRLEAKMKAAPIPKQTQELKQTAPDDAPAPLMIPLLDLTDQMCRWPVNSPERGEEFLFCAHGKERGSPYCSFHESIAWAGRPSASRVTPLRRAA